MTADRRPIPDFAMAMPPPLDGTEPRFSICTLVTRHGEYAEMVDSFVTHGFDQDQCEYLYVDNSEANRLDAFGGYNLFLSRARGEYVILCHQDVLLLDDGRAELEQRISELTIHDSTWALCGNAGGVSFTRLAIRISDPYGENQSVGRFPARATALDENFIVIRRDANLAVSHDLSGFHFYGADLCINADFLGRSAYVIDFHLRHKSAGKTDTSFHGLRKDVARKYQRAYRSRWIVTTVGGTYFYVSSSRFKSWVLSSRAVGIPRHIANLYRGIRLRLR